MKQFLSSFIQSGCLQVSLFFCRLTERGMSFSPLVSRVSLNLYFRSGTFSVTLKLEIMDRMDERSNN